MRLGWIVIAVIGSMVLGAIVCTCDRAGWSESGSRPPTVEQFAQELHTLLQNAGILDPYGLVGHSLGGFTVRVFVHEDSADVASAVLGYSGPKHPASRPVHDRLPRLVMQATDSIQLALQRLDQRVRQR